MVYLSVVLSALIVAALTLFSGFGLGTVLMPVFAVFFPVQMAVAATAVVHLANNVFKVGLVGRKADRRAVLAFGLPAAACAVVGAWLLGVLSRAPVLCSYALGGRSHEITVVKIAIAVLMIGFALFELLPRFEELAFDVKWLPLGGGLSGFFGGISGHQGALRSAFLINAGLTKEAFIGTGCVCAVIVDVTRLIVYGLAFHADNFQVLSTGGIAGPVVAATVAAFVGSYGGAKLMTKITLRTVQLIVGTMLFVLAVALGTGLA